MSTCYKMGQCDFICSGVVCFLSSAKRRQHDLVHMPFEWLWLEIMKSWNYSFMQSFCSIIGDWEGALVGAAGSSILMRAHGSSVPLVTVSLEDVHCRASSLLSSPKAVVVRAFRNVPDLLLQSRCNHRNTLNSRIHRAPPLVKWSSSRPENFHHTLQVYPAVCIWTVALHPIWENFYEPHYW